MCDTCGCGEPGNEVTIRKPGEDHDHSHEHDDKKHHHQHKHSHSHKDHPHTHDHDHHHDHENDHHHHHEHGAKIVLEQNIMQKNDLLAERNRGYFEAKNIFTLNLVSSPGSGKTSLLEKTIRNLKNDLKFYIIEGDQQTMNDANRIEAAGAPVVQINTGNGCHLDADMINKAVKKLDVADNSVLIIENVGNLVCPSLFDLGETHRIVIISVTEGEDKPAKYPTMFQSSDICIINKTDLLPYVDFNVEKAKEYALRVNRNLKFFELSAKTEEGMDKWYEWLKAGR
ncbi:MAG: hydrogenase nickel incorporation protein HypB [Bacteroidetes bacterium]|nr:hydrogenase nickel incorporation protein HypB [Bacteroidota bacterium]